MTISQQIKHIRDSASMVSFLAETSAKLSVASDRLAALEYLAQKPGVPAVVLVMEGETKRGEHEEFGRVDRDFILMVSIGGGMSIEAEHLFDEGPTGMPLYDLVEMARDAIRAVRFTDGTCEEYPDYKSIERHDVGEAIMDVMLIRFSVGTQLDAAI